MLRRISAVIGGMVVVLAWASAPVAAQPATASKLNWIVDGRVEAAVRLGNTLYIGGSFTSVAPGANALGTIHAVSSSTGQLAPAPLFPLIDGLVRAIVPDGSGGYYLSGEFATVGGVAQRHLTHIFADGTRDPAFAPQFDGPVSSLVRSGSSVYVAGFFSMVGGQPRHRVAQLDAATGQVLPWAPALSALFTPTLLDLIGGRLFVGGIQPGGASNLSAFDAATGSALWQTTLGATAGLPGDLAEAGGRLIVSGDFQISPAIRGVAALDPVTGAVDLSWAPNAETGFMGRMVTAGTTVYISGFFNSFGGQPRQGLAAFDAVTGAVLPWRPRVDFIATSMGALPNGNLVVGGARGALPPYRAVAQIDPAGTVTPWTSAVPVEQVSALAVDASGAVVVGSTLAASGAVPRLNLAAFDLTTGALMPWAPAASRSVFSMTTNGRAIFIGGAFDEVTGVPRQGLAAVDPVTGAVNGFDARLSGFVTRMLWHDDRIYVSGSFSLATATTPLINFARIYDTSALPDETFRPALTAVRAMTTAHGALYLAGFRPGAVALEIAAFDPATGARGPWSAAVAGDVSSVVVEGDTLYAGGLFTAVGGVPRTNLAALDRRSGRTLGFNPEGVGLVDSIALAEGLVVHIGGGGGLGGPIGALRQDGQPSGWNPGFSQTLVAGGSSTALVAGDVLVLTGMFGTLTPSPLQGVAAFDLSGARGPLRLRSTSRGPETAIEWDAADVAPASGYVIEAGANPGQVSGGLPLGAATSFVATLPPLDYFVRVRTLGAAGGAEQVSNEVLVRGGCTNTPEPPVGLTANLSGLTLTLTWTAPAGLVTHYVLTAGSAAGASDLASVNVGGAQLSIAGAVPPGTYFVRARAVNACGTSGPSGEVFFTAGAATALPAAPTGLAGTSAAGSVAMTWSAPAGAVTGYIVEAGSAPGLADYGTAALGPGTTFVTAGVPPGVYVVRVRAVNAAGSGPPSADVVLRVP